MKHTRVQSSLCRKYLASMTTAEGKKAEMKEQGNFSLLGYYIPSNIFPIPTICKMKSVFSVVSFIRTAYMLISRLFSLSTPKKG